MTRRSTLWIHSLLLAVVFTLGTVSISQARDRDNNPPGPKGGKGTNWENPPGPQGGKGASPDHRPAGWDKGNKEGWKDGQLPPGHMKHDRDNNPPGPKGGPGTNWENPPGPKGGPGQSPDGHPVKKRIHDKADRNGDGIVDENEKKWAMEKMGGPGQSPERKHRIDRDNNPPGPKGGKGTNWENPPGPQGGKGASPDRRKK